MKRMLATTIIVALAFTAGVVLTIAYAMPEQSAVVSYFNGLAVVEYINP